MRYESTIPNAGKGVLSVSVALLAGLTAQASTDYGPAVWRQVYSGHWSTTGYGHKFHVCHDMEGYYLTSISYEQRSTTTSSVHYCVNGKTDSSDGGAAPGEVNQGVRDAYYAWHALCWNHYSTGTEHEGFQSNPAWFTEALYTASAGVTRHLQAKFGWPMDRNHVIGHDQKRIAGWASYCSANFGCSGTCNSHTDPGPYWNWTHYMDLCKGTTSVPTAPSTLAASVVSSSQIKLTWKDNSSNETGFKIERSTSSGGTYTQIGTTGANVATYTASSLGSGTAYYFRVRSYNASGNSGYSNVASATTKDVVPGAPTSLTATATSSSQINLTWVNGSGNPDGVRIERSTDNVNFTQIAQVGVVTTYSNTGLAANTLYYYRVRAYNTAGNSAYSGTASDTTAPQAPSSLVATAASYNTINLTWVDNSSSENGFRVERSPDNVTFTQVYSLAAGVTSCTDTPISANTTYYYRVRAYNGNGNSSYSNTSSAKTPIQPPVLTAIANRTVAPNANISFTTTSTDPNHSVTTPWTATWDGNNQGDMEIMFRKPGNSGTTTAFIDTTATNYTMVVTNGPSGQGGKCCLKSAWTFKTGTANYWIRLTTGGAPSWPNPTVALDQQVQFRLYTTKALNVGLGLRETATSAGYGADGGTTGTIDWAGVTNVVSGNPQASHYVAANTWTTLTFNIPFEPQAAFTGDGKVDQSGAKGVLEHIVLYGMGGTGAYTTYMDDLKVILQNTLTFTLDAGAPTGATIERKTGKFSWTPTSGQAGIWNITVRVTDQLGAQATTTFRVNVTSGGNNPPVLAPIGSKTVNELSTLSFTASATDPDGGQTLTYTLDAGYPAGASINSSTGAFSWTPTEAQGPGSYPITVRVTDNGSPSSNDFETITVTVNEVNVAPVLATVADQTVNELSLLTVTPSATDSDIPANTLTWSLDSGYPAGMAINSASGVITWTPTEAQGPGVYPVTVRVTDNGSPVLYAKKSFNVTVNEVNTAPVLTLGTMSTNVTVITDFEDMDPSAYNGNVLFRVPVYSSTTSAFLDPSPNNTSIETNYPDLDVNTSLQTLYTSFSFKTGVTNPFVRLTTYTTVPTNANGAYELANPTIDLGARVRFDIWTDKSLKVALGVRETGTGAPIGADGGYSGTIEWVGSTATLSGMCPSPTHTVNASNWTTLEFNLPSEAVSAFTGNGVLATGKGTLESLALVPNGGSGTYNVYFDNFQVVRVTTNLTVDTGATITLLHTATDADLPANNLTFSLDTGAPDGASIDPVTGVFTWTPTPAQSPSTNLITVRVTDDGVPALSDAKTQTIIVNKVNTAPHLQGLPDDVVEINSGSTVAFNADATDDDVPADTLTYSLVGNVPQGATIDPVSGAFSWTPPSGVYSTNVLTFRVTDNGVPPLYDDQMVVIMVLPTNAAPVLSLGTARVDEMFANFESYTNNTPSEYVMFNKPYNSSTTTNYIDSTATNYTTVTTSFPSGHSSAKVLKIGWSFKTGASNYWVRLNTLNTASLPNPTISFTGKLRFDIYSTKSLKVGVGVRETGTSAAFGANGGTSGTIEYVGCTNEIGTTPIPTRTLTASNWTTLEFDMPTEPLQSLTGNGVLDGVKGTLEDLILLGNGGTGAYTVYVDNFDVATTTPLPGTVNMNVGSTLTFNAAATDADTPPQALDYTLDADDNTNATLNVSTGAFSWTPTTADIGTNSFTVTVQDEPTNGAFPKTDAKSLSVVVTADPFGVLSTDGLGFVAAGESVNMAWDAVVGTTYTVQTRASLADAWTTVGSVTASGKTASVVVSGGQAGAYYRVIGGEEGSALDK